MENAGLVLIGTIVGAIAGLLPKVLDMIAGSSSDKQDEAARLRAMLAGVLMSCVQSTNEFLEKAAQLHLDRDSSAGKDATDAHQREAVTSAFKMKTAWMHALVCFGDPADGKPDARRVTIQRMLTELDKTYVTPQGDEVLPEDIVQQLQKVETLSRKELQELIGLPAIT